MNCPSCKKTVKDGTSICPHCDAVLDESILGAMPDDDAVEDTPPPEVAPKKVAKRKPAPVSAAKPAAAAKAAPTGAYTGKYAKYWTDDETDSPSPAAAAMQQQKSNGSGAPEVPAASKEPSENDPFQQLKGIWTGFLALHFEDKLTAFSSFFLAVMAFMPWRTTVADGDDMGLLTWGFWTACLGFLSIAGIWLRKTGKLASIPRSLMPISAVAAGGLSALICVIFAFTSYERGVKDGKEGVLSEPAFGVFLALGCAALLVVGGMLTLKREK